MYQFAACDHGILHTKNPILGIFCSALELKILVYFMGIGNIVRAMGIFFYAWACRTKKNLANLLVICT
jgi:hypothetical protein